MSEIRMNKNLPLVAVVLQNLGGPSTLADVEPFLVNLFMDEDIIKIPFSGPSRKVLSKLIAGLRSVAVRKKYAEIGGGSPLNCWTELQQIALEKLLNSTSSPYQFKVVTAMRYWKPFTNDTLAELLKHPVDTVIQLPLYPQFSYTTSGSGFREWEKQVSHLTPTPTWKNLLVKDYHLNPWYIKAINDRITEGLKRFPESIRNQVHIVFSAHGTPVSEREAGDPYSIQIEATRQAVMKLRPIQETHWLMFQSKVGPSRWLEPNADTFIPLISSYGIKHVLVIPIAFVSDHIETVHEIGIEFAELAHESGIKQFEFTQGLNDHPDFIQALRYEVLRVLGLGVSTPVEGMYFQN
jgi:ferrochelatase